MIASPGRLPGQLAQQRPLPILEVAVGVDGTLRQRQTGGRSPLPGSGQLWHFLTISAFVNLMSVSCHAGTPFRLMDAPVQGTGA
jgi:hypothetical protein